MVSDLYTILLCVLKVHTFEVPRILIEPLSPKGLKVSIPHIEGINLFVFHGNLNAEVEIRQTYTISKTLGIHKNGKWMFIDPNINWKRGDVLNYWTYIEYFDGVQTLNYNITGEQVITKDLVSDEDVACIRSVTIVNGATIDCKDNLVFEDLFHYFDSGKWDVEIYNPFKGPNFEFNSYERDTVKVENDTLIIKPIPKLGLDEFREELDLRDGCTSVFPQDECRLQNHFLPAVKSGKITSRSTFKYGKIEIKAKLPAGDWIFPEVALVPKNKMNRVVKILIAYARGNENLQNADGEDIGARVLFCGPTKSSTEPERSENLANKNETTPFTRDFHIYSLIWLPDEISCYVDYVKIGKVTTKIGFPELNTEFHISLGVSVAGNNDFPDASKSGENIKPWKNKDRKQVISFFNARHVWSSTWKANESALKVRSVKVYSISKESRDLPCINSVTIVDGKTINKCVGSLVFEDFFDNLDVEKWRVEQFNPSGPNYEFSSYENKTVSTFDSNLLIKPVPLLLEEIRSQFDNLKNCAGFPECSNPQEYQVLVNSGRITSRSTFKYAKIEVKAKLPAGDWLFTEISFVPKNKANKETKIRIAYARGNQHLTAPDGTEFGASVLYCGPITSSSIVERDKHLLQRKVNVTYTSDYHTYKLNWLPNKITCSVDDILVGEVNISSGFPELNTEFHISLGIGVGGINDFPNDVISGQHTKPWENGKSIESRLEDFFAARDVWSSTWLADQSTLKVESIKIYAV